MSNSICVIKLVSGEELIAEITDRTHTTIVAKKVHSITVVPGADRNQYGLGLFPFLKGAPDETLRINLSAVIADVEAPSDLARAYLSQTSGIEIASSIALQ